MAKLPIEISNLTDKFKNEVRQAISLANSLQNEFDFQELDASDELKFLDFHEANVSKILDRISSFKDGNRGFHPFIIAIIDSYLEGSTYSNLFGHDRPESGISVITTHNVPEIVLPKNRMVSYFIYYFAKFTLSYICPFHKNHDDTRGCVYDRKVNKKDLMKSMKKKALCDECRNSLIDGKMTHNQFKALNQMFQKSGDFLENNQMNKPKIFIGSSTTGIKIAYKLQYLLQHDAEITVWNQGIFNLSQSFLESLEKALKKFEFGIFVFSDDDSINIKGEDKKITRDNVIFELGLFMGKLSRENVFVVFPETEGLHILSDLEGIVKAPFNPAQEDLAAALGPVAEEIRDALNEKLNNINR